jgi:hypothetical protein
MIEGKGGKERRGGEEERGKKRKEKGRRGKISGLTERVIRLVIANQLWLEVVGLISVPIASPPCAERIYVQKGFK